MSDETVNTLPPPHTGFQRYQKKKTAAIEPFDPGSQP